MNPRRRRMCQFQSTSWCAGAFRPGRAACALVALLAAGALFAEAADPLQPARPEADGRWIRPASEQGAAPLWGHAEGLRVGLWPAPGPRGLLRIYTPYLRQGPDRMMNFLAVEPIVQGQRRRGFSELEWSKLDNTRGKRFWSVDAVDSAASIPPRPPHPARGVIKSEKGFETLRVFIVVEPFHNGACVYLRLTFRSCRPYEVGINTFVFADSKPLDACIVTATMGNYARLRRLHLAERTVLSTDLWPRHEGFGFAPHKRFELAEFFRNSGGHAIIAATPDEPRPDRAQYARGTHVGWRYQGDLAMQFWRCEHPPRQLVAQVNGRSAYWASQTAIPGGVSYENFELVAPFENGQEFWFGVTPQTPEVLDDPFAW